MKTYTRSKELFDRAQNVLAGGVSSEFRKFSYPHPLFYTHGEGAHIFDVDGNDLLDFTLSQGPLILGHSHPHVLKSVEAASKRGQLFAGQHEDELRLAETIQRLIPCAELLRFSLSGAEADHTALRVARAATGRQKFLRFEGQYHGWFDNVSIGVSAPDEAALGSREYPNKIAWTAGLPDSVSDEVVLLPWNDLALVEKTLQSQAQEIAAIITEPVMCNNGCLEPTAGFLQGLRDLCDRYGIVLIFDEVITGFRLGMGGAQLYYGITPDLGIFGKAMASGYPISVICGKRFLGPENKPLMELVANSTVIHAGTMNSSTPTIAAALATIEVLENEGAHERLFALGQRLRAGLERVAKEMDHTDFLVQGPGPMLHAGFTDQQKVTDFRGVFSYDKARYAQFVRGMQENGVRLIGRGLWYISAAHTADDIDIAIATAAKVLAEMK